MKKISLLAIGAAALAVAGFSSAASAHERNSFSFGIVLGGPPVVVEDRGYDPERAYWEHREWERERWEARERWREHEWREQERARAEHAYWAQHDGDDENCDR